jgi:hypothetical protein
MMVVATDAPIDARNLGGWLLAQCSACAHGRDVVEWQRRLRHCIGTASANRVRSAGLRQ